MFNRSINPEASAFNLESLDLFGGEAAMAD